MFIPSLRSRGIVRLLTHISIHQGTGYEQGATETHKGISVYAVRPLRISCPDNLQSIISTTNFRTVSTLNLPPLCHHPRFQPGPDRGISVCRERSMSATPRYGMNTYTPSKTRFCDPIHNPQWIECKGYPRRGNPQTSEESKQRGSGHYASGLPRQFHGCIPGSCEVRIDENGRLEESKLLSSLKELLKL
ncbi:hypothetical protein BJY04DRAFT_160144 [Aspergillus karnatakaensis]|uniref:uncharacterized protein n=1 Tax=Aspergillus karnatakaensis TaxID=1810916 RepID=UPI003CCCCCC4